MLNLAQIAQVSQMATQLRNSNNPEQMLMNMFGNNPQVKGLLQVTKGANEQQLIAMVQQTCQQRGIDFNSLMQTLHGMGM